MAFDPQTRNRLGRFVTDARELIADEFTQKFRGLYGLSSSGEITALSDLNHLDEVQRGTAERLRARLRHLGPTSDPDRVKPEAIEYLAREQAFTVLNRLAAIRMAEKRGIIVESVGRGYESKGFKVYLQAAGNALGDIYHKYRRYLFCLFDELAIDLGVLFDRRSPAGLLFLREPSLLQLFELLNAPELEPLWAEDETIGLIYQYYNDPAERKEMREQSSAPRNSRELAVRNQFFTPRYVVEFLTDNTLGRIWFEMTKGQTRLKELCRYFVRRPNEIFLRDGEFVPESANSTDENLSQEELLKQPVHIPHRPLKDPRSIRMLDPACGSMHFGLYSFDLFEVIYDEAWEIAHSSDDSLKSSEAFSPFVDFVAHYSGKTAFLREVPLLIIEQNLHGIDIDLRCAQIAGLSLWLRAQRAWKQQHFPPSDRPSIRRSNIVCAEAMPGEEVFLTEFIEAQLSNTPEKSLLGQLLRRVFEAMKLGGEAGSLLRIEEEIADAVTEAKQLWLAGPKPEHGHLLSGATMPLQNELALNVTGITNEAFWEKAEERIYGALQTYAEQAELGGYQRRLFADDVARGFAFIDLSRKRYDVVLMNPPFGDPSKMSRKWLEHAYAYLSNDMSVCFVQRAKSLLLRGGAVGILSPRNPLFLESFADYRRNFFFKALSFHLLADLGFGVLDNAMIEVSAAVLQRPVSDRNDASNIIVFRLLDSIRKEQDLLSVTRACSGDRLFVANPHAIARTQTSPFCYWLTAGLLKRLANTRLLKDIAEVKWGLFTADDPRFLRGWWEVIANSDWPAYYKGGAFARFVFVSDLVVDWRSRGRTIKENRDSQRRSRSRLPNPEFYFKRGLSFPNVTFKGLAIRALPEGAIFSLKGPGIFPKDARFLGSLWSLLNSRIAELFVSAQSPTRRWDLAQIARIPIPHVSDDARSELEEIASECSKIELPMWLVSETSRYFCPHTLCFTADSLQQTFHAFSKQMLALRERRTFLANRIESVADAIYDLREEDRKCVDLFTGDARVQVEELVEDEDREDCHADEAFSLVGHSATVISFCVGCAFGRWDIRFATGEKPAPALPDPFEPLPVCPPGQLQDELGEPLTKEGVRSLQTLERWHYPLDLPWDGLLVDDPGHALDLEVRVHQVLQVIWKARWEQIERESCAILSVHALRDYFHKSSSFFADHLLRYSKSRRQAPIYWPISTASGSFTLWVYYHRLTEQTLHIALADFIEPKIKSIELDAQRQKEAGRTQQYGDSIDFLDELKELRAEIDRIIKLPWKPNLNDGVFLTASPLWKLFRHGKWQKDLKACWEKLEAGEYDWAHLACTIWPDRVREKCKTDRSLAIAHGLEELCIVEPSKPRKEKIPKRQVATEGGEVLLQAATVLATAPRPVEDTRVATTRAFESRQIPIDQTDRTDVLCAIRQLFNDSQVRDRDTSICDVAAALGYRRVGSRIREILDADLRTAVRRGILQNQAGQLSLLARDLRDYDRDFLKRNFLGVIGRGWIEREAAVWAFTKSLGFSRTGPVIEEAGYSLIRGLLRDRRLEADKDQIRRAAA
jgi:Eco57I restriction-modification methylase